MSKSKPKPQRAKAETNGTIEIGDGSIDLKIRGGPLDGRVFSIDVLTTKVALEEIELKHNTHDPEWKASPEFLIDLATRLESIGVEGCTPSMAYQIWHRVTVLYEDLKKNIGA